MSSQFHRIASPPVVPHTIDTAQAEQRTASAVTTPSVQAMGSKLPPRLAASPSMPAAEAEDTATPTRQYKPSKLGFFSCTTRASSSPPTTGMLPTHRSLTESAKRCLGKDLEVSDSEVDAAVEEGSRKLQFGPTELSLDDILSSPRPLRGFSAQVNTAAGDDVCSMGDLSLSANSSPSSAVNVDSPAVVRPTGSTQSNEGSAHAAHIDNAVLEMQGRFAAEVAAMRKDLQQCMNAEFLRELDAMKEKLSLQMKSQLAEQMVAVRKEFEGDMRSAVQVLESHLMRVEEDILKTSRWESDARDPSCNSPEPTRRTRSFSPSSPKLAKPSDEVGPRVVVDEERLRIKLDEIESTLDKHLESIELISKRLKTFASKAEVEALQSNVAAIEGSQAHRINELLSAISAQIVAAQQMEKQILSVEKSCTKVTAELRREVEESLEKKVDSQNFSALKLQLDSAIKLHEAPMVLIEQKLEEVRAEVARQRQDIQDSFAGDLSTEIHALRAELSHKSSEEDTVALRAWIHRACETSQQTINQLRANFEHIHQHSESMTAKTDVLERMVQDANQAHMSTLHRHESSIDHLYELLHCIDGDNSDYEGVS